MKLRRRLTLGFVLTATLPAALVAALHSYSYLRNTEATAEAHVQRLVQGAAQTIDDVMQNVARDVRAFVIAGNPREHSPHELAGHLAAYTYAYPYFREILWVGPRGVVLASSSPEHHGKALTDIYAELGDDLARALRQPAGRLHISDFDDTTPRVRDEIAAGRVRPDMLNLQLLLRADDVRGNTAGVLVATLTTQVFVTVLEDLERSIPGAKPVTLLSRRSEVLLSSDARTPLLRSHALATRVETEMNAGGQAVSQFEINLDGEDEEVTIAQTAGLGTDRHATWRVVAMQSEHHIRDPVFWTLLQTLALLGAIIILGGYIGLWMVRTLVRPIEDLAGLVQRIGAGDLSTRANIKGDDEVRGLAQAFNVMATSLEREQKMVERTNQALETSNRALDMRHRRSQLLTEMTGLLQSVRDLNEAGQVLPRFLEPLFAPNTGALYVITSSLNYLDQLACWGKIPLAPTFEISDCWGLRRGQPYLVEQSDSALVCPHVAATRAGQAATLCVPMMAEGAALGLLHLACEQPLPDAATAQAWREHAQRVAEQLGLALANLKLRKQLRDQSIRDILTGLHNRRYLEESLPRELARAEREKYPVAVFMLDVDHFKMFNDSYGHEAGDAVLHALGRVLNESVRAGDLACRFGGEELTVALPRVSPDQAREWAARVMQRVRSMEVSVGGQSLPAITVSIGLAFSPEHGTDPETVIQAADLALYEAKRAGRDRLVVFVTTAPGQKTDQGTP